MIDIIAVTAHKTIIGNLLSSVRFSGIRDFINSFAFARRALFELILSLIAIRYQMSHIGEV